MLIPTLLMGLLALILLIIGYQKGGGQHVEGLRLSFIMTIEVLPLLIFAFIVAGMVQVLVSTEFISKWVGEGSGMRGIFLGSIAGGLTPGGPFVSLPIAVGFWKSGASVGTMVAFLTGWALLAGARIPMEVGILGWKLTMIRLASTFFFPPIAGWLAQTFFGHMR